MKVCRQLFLSLVTMTAKSYFPFYQKETANLHSLFTIPYVKIVMRLMKNLRKRYNGILLSHFALSKKMLTTQINEANCDLINYVILRFDTLKQ